MPHCISGRPQGLQTGPLHAGRQHAGMWQATTALAVPCNLLGHMHQATRPSQQHVSPEQRLGTRRCGHAPGPAAVQYALGLHRPVECFWQVDEKPTENYGVIGGLDKQIQELVEAVVLPVTHAEKFKKLGIKPPKGVLLYGPPGADAGCPLSASRTQDWSRPGGHFKIWGNP